MKRIYADAELASGAMIDLFRERVGSEWVIRAPQRDIDVGKLPKITPNNCVGYVEDVSWNTSDEPGPNVFAYPFPSSYKNDEEDADNEDDDEDEEGDDDRGKAIEFELSLLKTDNVVETLHAEGRGQSQLSIDLNSPIESDEESDLRSFEEDVDALPSDMLTKSNSTHGTYLTDRSFDELRPDDLHFRYKKRWGIEVTMDHLQNSFMPYTESKFPEVRIYTMHLAILFQNWYTLINRAQSPDISLRLDPIPQEVLKAIQDSAAQQHSVDSSSEK